MGVRLKARLLAVWHAFRLRPAKIVIEPYHNIGYISIGAGCDLENYKGQGEVCMSRTILTIEFNEDDHAHVCSEHARHLKGRTGPKHDYQ